jgi:Leucine-rich repeat (LRR) protein
MPPTLFTLKNLRVLELGDNYISTLPDEIEKLQELRILALWDNPIDYYPNALGSLKNLTHLDFLHNQMSYGTQDRILQMIDQKKTKVYFSTPCACEDGH